MLIALRVLEVFVQDFVQAALKHLWLLSIYKAVEKLIRQTIRMSMLSALIYGK